MKRQAIEKRIAKIKSTIALREKNLVKNHTVLAFLEAKLVKLK